MRRPNGLTRKYMEQLADAVHQALYLSYNAVADGLS